MTVHSDHHRKGEDTIPPWLWLTSIGLIILTILCFLIMLAGML
jgi:hypothetical protein